ncbi:MAG: hypothetical protein QOE79_1539 [Sphingomonadales bacterium]|jgi:hypothetical protein|nr:hypothetical protein [Sphingomonadales bacterium]MEA3050013.1 hypothetical protein [Sphingomonadales bacterium]
MLESLETRAAAIVARRARQAVADLAAALKADAPRGVRVEERPGGVALTGRGLLLRRLIDQALRWMVERTRR